MADKSAIEWTDATWNPIVGCSIVSPGGYPSFGVGTHQNGTTRKVNGNTIWTGKVALAPERILTEPLRWRAPRRIFVNSMGDLFHEDVPDAWIDQVFAVMALAPQHTFQVLTKRARRMRDYMTHRQISPLEGEMSAQPTEGVARHQALAPAAPQPVEPTPSGLPAISPSRGEITPLPNVWLGVSAERQQEADERIPELLATPAAIRFVSGEPLLGPINFRRIRIAPDHHTIIDALDGYAITESISGSGQERTKLDWIIVGGESGPGARPMHPAWPLAIRDQCQAAGVPFFFKQWGVWRPYKHDPSDTREKAKARGARDIYGWQDGEAVELFNKKAAGRLLDGVEHNAMPQLREVSAL